MRNGDRIKLDVENRRIDLLVDVAELTRRKAEWTAPKPHAGADRGYLSLYLNNVNQADQGCDFDFLRKTPLHPSKA